MVQDLHRTSASLDVLQRCRKNPGRVIPHVSHVTAMQASGSRLQMVNIPANITVNPFGCRQADQTVTRAPE